MDGMKPPKGLWIPVAEIEAEIGPEKFARLCQRLEAEKNQRAALRKERAAASQKLRREAIKEYNKLYATSETVRNMGFELWFERNCRNKTP
jgi:hypothetical protein